ncbi:hypothetical protein NFI96_000354 [Prochilodus magdalenae]|nr:hypothetical protein NFI96_000354 [Prochilodus magdalenae]
MSIKVISCLPLVRWLGRRGPASDVHSSYLITEEGTGRRQDNGNRVSRVGHALSIKTWITLLGPKDRDYGISQICIKLGGTISVCLCETENKRGPSTQPCGTPVEQITLASEFPEAAAKDFKRTASYEYSGDESKAAEISHMDIEALKKLNKNMKLVKKLAKKYDAFLASESRILGPGLNKAGKFPSLLTHNENLITKVDEVKSTIKFQIKKVLCLAVAGGHVRMSEDELVYNIHRAGNFLVSLLKKNWQNVRALYVKSTMGKPQRLTEQREQRCVNRPLTYTRTRTWGGKLSVFDQLLTVCPSLRQEKLEMENGSIYLPFKYAQPLQKTTRHFITF